MGIKCKLGKKLATTFVTQFATPGILPQKSGIPDARRASASSLLVSSDENHQMYPQMGFLRCILRWDSSDGILKMYPQMGNPQKYPQMGFLRCILRWESSDVSSDGSLQKYPQMIFLRYILRWDSSDGILQMYPQMGNPRKYP